MLVDWFFYGLLTWGLATLLNATAFKNEPANRTTAWILATVMFFVSVVALTALKIVRFRMLSQEFGVDLQPRGPFDAVGGFIAAWWFFSLLRKAPKAANKMANVIATSGDRILQTNSPSKSSQQGVFPNIAIPNVDGEKTMGSGAMQSGSGDAGTVNEEAIYESIASEIESRNLERGLWTRLFAECDGDENRTKVLYIKQRAAKLIEMEKVRIAEREHAKELAKLEKKRLDGLSIRDRLSDQNMTEELAQEIAALSKTSVVSGFMEKILIGQLRAIEAYLIEKPLLVAITTSEGDTPLHIATKREYQSTALLLLEYGARTDVKNKYGETPLDVALKQNSAILAMLAEPKWGDGSPKGQCPNCKAIIPLDANACPKCIAVFPKDDSHKGWKVLPLGKA